MAITPRLSGRLAPSQTPFSLPDVKLLLRLGRRALSKVERFWEEKSLGDMTRAEWESLCDGCGRCCLVTLEDEDEPDELAETSLHCRLYDPETRTCTCYSRRAEIVPECVPLTPRNIAAVTFMPKSCAYRRLAEGRGLASWHPLVSGDPASVERAGIAAPKDLTSEQGVRERDLWHYVTGTRSR